MEELINECDIVVNFAAESFVDKSINDANPFLIENIIDKYLFCFLIH